jgi:ATP-dependent DNA ligase
MATRKTGDTTLLQNGAANTRLIAPPNFAIHRRSSRCSPNSRRIAAWRGFLFEPKWDGFRAIVFRGESDVFIQSRDLRPLDRYFRSCTRRCCKDFRRAALSMARS